MSSVSKSKIINDCIPTLTCVEVAQSPETAHYPVCAVTIDKWNEQPTGVYGDGKSVFLDDFIKQQRGCGPKGATDAEVWEAVWTRRARYLDAICPCGTHTFTHTDSGSESESDEELFEEKSSGLTFDRSPPQDAEAIKRATGVIRGSLLILKHHGAPGPVIESLTQQALHYLVHPDEAVFFKRAKYYTVVLMARYLRQELPKAPDLIWKPTGQFLKWARPRLRRFSRKNTHLWYSFLQGKRSAHQVSDALVLSTYESHRQAMQIKDPIDDITHDSVMKELEPVLQQVRRQALNLFAMRDVLTHAPSRSACLEESRSYGGQFAMIQHSAPKTISMKREIDHLSRTDPVLVRMAFYPVFYRDGRVHYNVTISEYDYFVPVEGSLRKQEAKVYWKDTIRQQLSLPIDERRINDINPIRGRKDSLAGSRPLKAKIQAILEPLKVRVISKGPALEYYSSKDLQVALHTAMRRMPCFRLIGRPLCPTDLIDLSENRCILGEGDYQWFSVDYSAATDNLSARLSASILSFLIDGIDEEMKEIFLKVLAPHLCSYPKVDGVQLKPVQQTNGQLMGSPLSFPILCLANLGLYLENTKQDTRPLRDRLKGVLVNGDDMIYVAKPSLWQTHVEIGDRVGLTMSIGKSYMHPVYANANSACFHYDLKDVNSTPTSIPFLNAGLYFGQSKVLQEDGEDHVSALTSTINRLVMGSLPGKQADLLSQYLSRHKTTVSRECKGRNLFIPISLGGMGVVRPRGFDTEFTWQQKAVARELYVSQPYAWQGHGPVPGLMIEEYVEPRNPWDTPPEPKTKRLKSVSHTFDIMHDVDIEKPLQVCRKRRTEAAPTLQRPFKDAVPPRIKREAEVRSYLIETNQERLGRYVDPWVRVGNDLFIDISVFELANNLFLHYF